MHNVLLSSVLYFCKLIVSFWFRFLFISFFFFFHFNFIFALLLLPQSSIYKTCKTRCCCCFFLLIVRNRPFIHLSAYLSVHLKENIRDIRFCNQQLWSIAGQNFKNAMLPGEDRNRLRRQFSCGYFVRILRKKKLGGRR